MLWAAHRSMHKNMYLLIHVKYVQICLSSQRSIYTRISFFANISVYEYLFLYKYLYVQIYLHESINTHISTYIDKYTYVPRLERKAQIIVRTRGNLLSWQGNRAVPNFKVLPIYPRFTLLAWDLCTRMCIHRYM